MKKKESSPVFPNEKEYFRCKKCLTIVIGNAGICPKCQTLQSEKTFERVIPRDEMNKEKHSVAKRELVAKILSSIALILSVLVTLGVAWFPFFGILASIVSLTISIIAIVKTSQTTYRKFAFTAFAIAGIGFLLGLMLTYIFGGEFVAWFRN